MDSLRKTIKELKEEKKLFMDSPEGIAYKKRKAREYYKVYREENREKNRKYQKEYYKLYGQI
tara:strand:+ start:812 stop:997 length:186 start_codon:yes stop_codon:yes gene_type:complete